MKYTNYDYGFEYGYKKKREEILELIEERIGEWVDYVDELLSKVDYEPEPDGEIKPSQIEEKEIRVAIIDTISRIDDFEDLKQKLDSQEIKNGKSNNRYFYRLVGGDSD